MLDPGCCLLLFVTICYYLLLHVALFLSFLAMSCYLLLFVAVCGPSLLLFGAICYYPCSHVLLFVVSLHYSVLVEAPIDGN